MRALSASIWASAYPSKTTVSFLRVTTMDSGVVAGADGVRG